LGRASSEVSAVRAFHRVSLCLSLVATAPAVAGSLSAMEELGKALFFDSSLSEPPARPAPPVTARRRVDRT